MSEPINLHSLAPEKTAYDVIYAWIHFPNRIVLFVQRKGQVPIKISCGECLSGSLQLLDTMTFAYGQDYEAMLLKQVIGETAKTKLFPKDPTKDEEDVKHAIMSFL